MATFLETLIAKLTLDGAGFERGLQQAQQKASAFANTAGGIIKSRLGAAFTTAGVVAFGRSIIETASNIKDLADRLDVTTDTIQKLETGGRMVGVSMQTIENNMTKLLDGIHGGSNEAVAGLDLLGMSLEEVRAMSFDDAVNAIAKNLSAITDNGVKAEAAMNLFGSKGGLKALQVLQEMQNADTSKMFSQRELDQLDRAGDELSNAFRRVQVVASGVFNSLFVDPFQYIGAMIGSGGDTDAAMKALAEIRNPKISQKTPIGGGDRDGSGAAFDAKLEEARKWMAIQDEILKLEEETKKNFEDVRVGQLTAEERRNELLTERVALLKDINALSDLDAAKNLNRVSEIDKELLQLNGKNEAFTPQRFSTPSNWLQQIGGNTTSTGGGANLASEMGRAVGLLREIKDTLASKGIRLNTKF